MSDAPAEPQDMTPRFFFCLLESAVRTAIAPPAPNLVEALRVLNGSSLAVNPEQLLDLLFDLCGNEIEFQYNLRDPELQHQLGQLAAGS